MGKSTGIDKIQLGQWGELQAAKFLKEKGYQIIEQNVRTPYGEIDLVAKFAGALIFVEVKTRRSNEYGHPEEAVTDLKRAHMIDSAESYLQEHTDFNGDWQIDVIAVLAKSKSQLEFHHFENIA
ncbi:MAG: YraN family protein [Chloroflexota bacterium]